MWLQASTNVLLGECWIWENSACGDTTLNTVTHPVTAVAYWKQPQWWPLDLACKLSVVLSSPVLASEWPPVPAAVEPESPEGLMAALLFAAIIARPARLPRGSTKHWDLPVLQMGKCTSRDDLNSRETIIAHWKCQDLCGTGLKGAATDRQCSICWLRFTLRLRSRQNPTPHQF